MSRYETLPYDELLPLLREREQLLRQQIGYDPVGYAEELRKEHLEKNARSLDAIFSQIHRRVERLREQHEQIRVRARKRTT